MYNKQVEHMLTRFDEAKRYIKSHFKLDLILRSKGKEKVDFCKDFEENSDLLKKIALYLATQVTNSSAACYCYAAAIAFIAEELGYSYDIYAGLAVNTEKEPMLYNKVKDDEYSEKSLPFMANYVFVSTEDNSYDYLDGFDNIEHIYVTKQQIV